MPKVGDVPDEVRNMKLCDHAMCFKVLEETGPDGKQTTEFNQGKKLNYRHEVLCIDKWHS